jgi:hypothetical protein
MISPATEPQFSEEPEALLFREFRDHGASVSLWVRQESRISGGPVSASALVLC